MRATDRDERVDPSDYDVHEVGESAEMEGETDAIVSRPGVQVIERELSRVEVRAVTEQLSVLNLDVEAGWPGVAPHVHADHADAFYVIDGTVEFLLGGETVRAEPRTLVVAPPGVEHGLAAAGAPARLLNLHAPDAGYVDSLLD